MINGIMGWDGNKHRNMITTTVIHNSNWFRMGWNVLIFLYVCQVVHMSYVRTCWEMRLLSNISNCLPSNTKQICCTGRVELLCMYVRMGFLTFAMYVRT